ncbi:alpha/beta fold hydrolase [Pseudomonas sp. CDFA 602]|uniref:alpha/beta hydrolase n=1 Tax=Pseudomonas californiensis TaxID=2829823 RepID=UPI001E6202D0|nr:alpha/beta fold hydrolase [Pseudomonas californiensis]MCD5996426.1 alpha/beta fold hydrolase [Pseudomonas californiensis]MCD6002025.1 alpha/beta fold hydrolase [Pseudomonas californiensis]
MTRYLPLSASFATLVTSFWLCTAFAGPPPIESVEDAVKFESSLFIPSGHFWDTPTGAPGVPGQLIRSEPADNYHIPKGASATRILYWSNDLYQSPTVASAVLIKPAGTAPKGGFPLVVWAHGTMGVGKMCGASNSFDAGYNVMPLLAQGFAVLAVDYAGLATEGGHAYMNKIVNATDVINAVPAAQKAVTGVTRKWVAIGHSQGGQAVWGVAEQQASRKDPNYLAAVALAPAVGGAALLEDNASQPGALFYPVYMARAIKQQFPRFDINTMLTAEAAGRYDDLVNKGCYFYAQAAFAHVKPGSVLKQDWASQPYVSDFFAINQVGNKPIAGSLLVAIGASDAATPPAVIETQARKACAAGNALVLRSYPGDHVGMLQTSLADVTAWIKDRFAAKPVTGACKA